VSPSNNIVNAERGYIMIFININEKGLV